MRIRKFSESLRGKAIMDYNDYFNSSVEGLRKLVLIDSESKIKNEPLIQRYFEEHPSTLLGALSGIQCNYKIEGNLIISQPRLKSVQRDRQPDFLIITGNSLELYFNFIEIEAPAKKIFKKSQYGLSREFFDAHSQLVQWRSFNSIAISDYCRHVVATLFKDNTNFKVDRKHFYNFILVYGDSKEVIGKNDESYSDLMQSNFVDKDLHHVTYSRLIAAAKMLQPLICVKRKATVEQYEAIGMDPFKDYQIDEWLDFHNIGGKKNVINKSLFLTNSEKEFLTQKIEKLDKLNSQQMWKLDNENFEEDQSFN